MKKIFCILFLTIIITKAFPDEGEKGKREYVLTVPLPEIATAELGIDLWGGYSSLYWKSNFLSWNFVLYDDNNYYDNNHIFVFQITPVIVSKNWDIPSYNFSFANLKISYIFPGQDMFPLFVIKPFLEINYLILKDKIFDFNTLNLQAGVRVGINNILAFKDSFYFETGYTYKNNRHNYFFAIGISPFPFWFPYPTV